MTARTMFGKLWDRHVVMTREDGASLLYVDCHLLQDGSAPAFAMLRKRGLAVRVPVRTFGTPSTVMRQLAQRPAAHKRPRRRWYLKLRESVRTPPAQSAAPIVSPW